MRTLLFILSAGFFIAALMSYAYQYCRAELDKINNHDKE